MNNQSQKQSRIVVVSNRLPFTLSWESGELVYKNSSGGLVSAMSSFLNNSKQDFAWIGWPGATVNDNQKEAVRTKALEEYKSYPIFLPEKVMDKFYHGFCNKTIWPLFHYFPLLAAYDEEQWDIYRKVNQDFCNVCIEVVKPGDTVWIHDYHLMLLPELLRKQMPEATISFFLHIPFPSYEIFRLIPRKWSVEILEGLLGADLIGFHTHDYTQYFLRNVLRILGYEHNLGRILLPERIAESDTFPIGIDYKKFNEAYKREEVKKEIEELNKILGERKVIFSVDRLDYTKGIINRLQGYEVFLEKNPSWRNKIVFILVVVPSRVSVEHYQQMKNKIDELVGKINGKYGDVKWTPIVYQYKSLEFSELSALYSLSDIALITPLRDGMNLVAKEYVASRTNSTGVLILSELAGAAKELGEAIIINPNHKEEIAQAILDAAEMGKEEQEGRIKLMQKRIESYNVYRWVEDFLEKTGMVKEEQKKYKLRFISNAVRDQIAKAFSIAQKRLILLDYDGTLIQFYRNPLSASPDKELTDLLGKIANYPNTDLFLISGRNKDILEQWFGNLPLGLVAEHGAWIREKGGVWELTKPLTSDWKPKLHPILKLAEDRLPRSFIEEKEHSLAWHYRTADQDQASLRVKELIDNMTSFTANMDIQILKGDKVVEIRNSGINKGNAIMPILSSTPYDFTLAIGDDWTDEDLFRILPKKAYSIRVGNSQSCAQFNVFDFRSVRNLLKEIIL